jgi:hypothetical protein
MWWETRDIEKLKFGIEPFIEEVVPSKDLPFWVKVPLQVCIGMGAGFATGLLVAGLRGAFVGALAGLGLDWIIVEKGAKDSLSVKHRIMRRIVEDVKRQRKP